LGDFGRRGVWPTDWALLKMRAKLLDVLGKDSKANTALLEKKTMLRDAYLLKQLIAKAN
jgi:hypothetical protein